MSQLTGKVAIVTGASKGIGAGIAKGLGAAGAAVVVNYASSKVGADRVVAEITSQGGQAIAVQGDVSKAADVQRLFAETQQAFGGLDVLVNNAGVYQFDPLEAVTESRVPSGVQHERPGADSRDAGGGQALQAGGGQRHQHRLGRESSGAATVGRLHGDQGRRGRHHAGAGQGVGRPEDPGQLDQPGGRGDGRGPSSGDHRQRLRKADDCGNPARTLGAAGGHRADRGVSGLGGLRMADGRDPGGVRRLPVRQREPGWPAAVPSAAGGSSGQRSAPGTEREPRNCAPSSCQGWRRHRAQRGSLDSGSFVAHLEVSAPGGCRTPFVSPGGWRKPGWSTHLRQDKL